MRISTTSKGITENILIQQLFTVAFMNFDNSVLLKYVTQVHYS